MDHFSDLVREREAQILEVRRIKMLSCVLKSWFGTNGRA